MKLKKRKLYVAYVDFSRCFDVIPRSELFFKLINSGVDGKFLNVVKNMYSHAKSCVQYNNEISFHF